MAERNEVRNDVTNTIVKPTRKRKTSGAADPFFVDPAKIPKGTSYNWKRVSYAGQTDDAHQIDMRENGWSPVPSSRHPEFTLKPSATAAIIRKGMMLMERPQELTDEAVAEELYEARKQVRDKEALNGMAPAGTLDRTLNSVKKNYEVGEIPME